MSLHKLSNIPKRKLKLLKSKLDSFRKGMLTDEQIENLKLLNREDYRKKLGVILNMCLLQPDEINRLTAEVFPWWAPFKKLGYVLISVFLLFFSLRSFQYFTAPRVYLIKLEQSITFNDGSVVDFDMIKRNNLIINKGELYDIDFFNWIMFSSKKTNMDVSIWTTDKNLSDNMIEFYGDLFVSDTTINPQGGWCISYLERYSSYFSALELFNKVYSIKPDKNLKIDLKLPNKGKYRSCKPFIASDNTFSKSFFISLKDKNSTFLNLKLDFTINGFVRVEEIKIRTRGLPINDSKFIWVDDDKIAVGKSYLYNKSDSLDEYLIPLDSNVAYYNPPQ